MPFEHYIRSGGKLLRCGLTTGTCAALAAAGAAELLLTGRAPEAVTLTTPGGIPVEISPDRCERTPDGAVCAVRKDAGDDIDVTDGMEICAEVSRSPEPGILVDGGTGIGRVTKPGLDQPVGAAAINRVPRQMIRDAAEAVCRKTGYSGGLRIIISAPEGAAAAEKTFNPKLGIQGGISILGTSGIVEPMSMDALRDTVTLEVRQYGAMGETRLILTPGNYGMDFLASLGLRDGDIPVIKCSNFIGDAIDEAGARGFASLLLVGHIGKLVKLAGGIFNTHSRWGDCRAELFCAHSCLCGVDGDICRELMHAATTDACIEILDRAGVREPVMQSLLSAMDRHLRDRAGASLRIGTIVFSNRYGLLGRTDTAEELLKAWT